MDILSKLNIDLAESFPLLARAPIIEAVIEVLARAEVQWEQSAILSQLKMALPDYPKIESQHESHYQLKVEPGQPPEHTAQDLGWTGFRFQSADPLQIAQFNRDRFVFSRLHPYHSWDQFRLEALRLWQLHAELAQPAEVQRLGLRFINRMALPAEQPRLEDYLQVSPQPPRELDLPFATFFHQDTLLVPGHSYAINIIRTVQPPQGTEAKEAGLIVDIDVFTTTPLEPLGDVLQQRLTEMRWLKNKVFFGSLTQKALESFQ